MRAFWKANPRIVMACTAILRATAAAFRNCLSIDIETARAERSGAVLCSTGIPQRHAPDCERYGGMGKAGNSDNVLHVAESEVRHATGDKRARRTLPQLLVQNRRCSSPTAGWPFCSPSSRHGLSCWWQPKRARSSTNGEL